DDRLPAGHRDAEIAAQGGQQPIEILLPRGLVEAVRAFHIREGPRIDARAFVGREQQLDRAGRQHVEQYEGGGERAPHHYQGAAELQQHVPGPGVAGHAQSPLTQVPRNSNRPEASRWMFATPLVAATCEVWKWGSTSTSSSWMRCCTASAAGAWAGPMAVSRAAKVRTIRSRSGWSAGMCAPLPRSGLSWVLSTATSLRARLMLMRWNSAATCSAGMLRESKTISTSMPSSLSAAWVAS